MSIKQVIVIRKDLNMRRGKEIAQGSHASIAFIAHRLEAQETYRDKSGSILDGSFSAAECAWLNGSFTKITLQVDSEQALLDVYNKAKEAGLVVYMVTDAGATEFNGVPTKTCLAIGPDRSELIDKITGDLKLY